MAGRFSDDQVRCSFCHKTQDQVHKLIAGPDGVYICDECVDICAEIIEEENEEEPQEEDPKQINLLKPVQIKEFLDDYVIGQEEAKKVLSVAVYNHYKRVTAGADDDGVELQKSNIIMLGPTGSGKTYLAQSLAKIINVPFAIADATTLTEAGYVGEDVENILLKLIQAADYDIERAQLGIVYLDEIDKIASRSEISGADVSRAGVQRDLLPLVEGTTVNTKYGMIKTDHILFIASGAFQLAKPSDLIPELQGRFPIRVELESLSIEDFEQILTSTEASLISQYKALLATEGMQLEFNDEAIRRLAEISYTVNERTENIGARRLYTVMERLLEEISFTAVNYNGTLTIDKDYVNERLEALSANEDLSRYVL